MKKFGKICVSLAFILCCLIGITVNAQAATIVDSGICGVDLTWTLDSDGKLTISGTGAMTDSGPLSGILNFNESIKTVIFKSGVTHIGNYSFKGCGNLISVSIPSTVKTIGEGAFQYCWELSSITIPNSVTSIGNEAFYSSGVASAKIGSRVTTIGDYAFHNCDNLKSVVLGKKVKTIGIEAFSGCGKLTSISIPNSVKTIGQRAFYGSGLTSIYIPANVTTVGEGAFYYCGELVSASISNGITTIANDLFRYCHNLKSVTLPNGITSIGKYAFWECEKLESISIPKTVTTIEDTAFAECTSLKTVIIPPNVTNIGNAFTECYSLRKVFFTGHAPTMKHATFMDTSTAVFYPKNDSTWTEDVRQQYRGTLTWIPYTPLKIKTQPKTVSVADGTSARVSVKAAGDGLTYQWYFKSASASKYTKSSVTTAAYSCKMSSKVDGRYVRCKITDKYGNSVWTNTVRLNMTKLGIKTQPASKSVVAGKTAKFTVAATGSGLKYQWQYRTSSSGSWKSTSATGNKTKTLSISATTAKHGYQYRCKITDSAGNVIYTKAVSMYVLGIKTQPANKTVKEGAVAKFTVKATGKGLTYQWQYRTSSKGSWKNVSAASGKKATYGLTTQDRHNGYQYRCRITDSAGNVVYSKTVKLTVK